MSKSRANQCSKPQTACTPHVPSNIMRMITNGNVPPPPLGMYPGTDAVMEQRRTLDTTQKRPSWRVPSVKISF